MGLPEIREPKTKGGFEVKVDATDMGVQGTLRYNILSDVLNENYDLAIQALKDYGESDFKYPEFKERIYRYINHSIDLIYAIKTKRNFPGMSSLTRAKQQELHEKFKEHFKELQFMLKKIEDVYRSLKVQDVRSTIYVVRALTYSVGAIAGLYVLLEIVNGAGRTALFVLNDFAAKVIIWLF